MEESPENEQKYQQINEIDVVAPENKFEANRSDDKPFKCKEKGCTKSFKRKDYLITHMTVHSSEKPFVCSFEGCGKAFKIKKNMKEHMHIHSDDRPFKCSHEGCDKAFKRKYVLTVHQKVHTAKPSKNEVVLKICDHPGCGATVREGRPYYEHTQRHKRQRCIPCIYETCKAVFCYNSELKQHVKRKHIKGVRFFCNFDGCNRSYSRVDRLNIHKKSHFEESIENSTKTEVKFAIKNEISSEQDGEKSVSDLSRLHYEKPYKCWYENCGKFFRAKRTLDKHMLTHIDSDARNFKCPYVDCEETFVSKSTLFSHIRRHKYEKRFTCVFGKCVAAFHESGDLNRHMRRHTGERYLCDQVGCNKSYTCKKRLRFHQKIHITEIENLNERRVKEENSIIKEEIHHESEGNYKIELPIDQDVVTTFNDECKQESLETNVTSKVHNSIAPYKCTFKGCQKNFQCKSSLYSHTLKHKYNGRFRCNFEGCDAAFYEGGAFKRHTRRHIGQRFPCSYDGCDKSYSRIDRLNLHKKAHSNSEKEDEPIVKEEILDIKDITEEIDLKPSFCHEEPLQANREQQDEVLNVVIDKPYKCHYKNCNKSYTYKGNLKEHFLWHTDDKPFKCNYEHCGKSFIRKTILSLHLRTHTKNSGSNFVMKLCDYPGCRSILRGQQSYYQHMRRHKRIRRFACNFEGCEAVFPESRDLRRHTRKHTGERYFCNYKDCKKSYTSEDSLHFHQKIHAKNPANLEDKGESLIKVEISSQQDLQKSYKCQYGNCGRLFGTQKSLDKHTLLHVDSENAAFKCSYEDCEKAFPNKTALFNHIRRHKFGKPYCCTFEECGASFNQSGGLKRHMKSHVGERFSCDYEGCHKSYSRKDRLGIHKQTHSGKTHSCPFENCPKTFKTNELLRVHLKSHEKEDHGKGKSVKQCSTCSEVSGEEAKFLEHVESCGNKCTFEFVEVENIKTENVADLECEN